MKSQPKLIFNGLLAISLLSTTVACSLNTPLDDHQYRSMGASHSPQPQQLTPEDAQLISAADPNGAGQLFSKLAKSATARQHLVRYGHPVLINKIIKTARIHCQPMKAKVHGDEKSYWGSGQQSLRQCRYQFPQHCGGHGFTVMEYNNKQLLVFSPKNSDYHLLDLISGSPTAKAGLWDQDDRVASKVNNLELNLTADYNRVPRAENDHSRQALQPLQLGWILRTSLDEETKLGQVYHRAVLDIAGCF